MATWLLLTGSSSPPYAMDQSVWSDLGRLAAISGFQCDDFEPPLHWEAATCRSFADAVETRLPDVPGSNVMRDKASMHFDAATPFELLSGSTRDEIPGLLGLFRAGPIHARTVHHSELPADVQLFGDD